jgi:hypothetical protein
MNYKKIVHPQSLAELLIFTFCIIAIFVFLDNFLILTSIAHHADTAFLLELVSTKHPDGTLDSKILGSIVDASSTWTSSFLDVCAANLQPSTPTYDVLNNHGYYNLFLFSWLGTFFTPSVILSSFHCFSFLALIFFSYLYLRLKNVSVAYSLVFCFYVVTLPSWNLSFTGDYYMDRFYMGFAFIYLITLDLLCNDLSKKYYLIYFSLLSAILAALMTERAAFMVAFASFAFLFLNFEQIKNNRRLTYWLTFIGVFFTLFFIWYLKFRFVGLSNGGTLLDLPNKILALKSRFASHESQSLLITFLIINFGMLGFFSFFSNWKVILLAFAILIPNLLVTVGGAELNGWSTHYHSMYLPLLIYFSLLGFCKLAKSNQVHYKKLFLLIPIFFLLCFEPYSGKIHIPKFNVFNTGILGSSFDFLSNSKNSTLNNINLLTDIDKSLPLNVKISTIEGLMPALLNKRDIYYYPIGIQDSDFVILPFVKNGGMRHYYGAVSYLGDDHLKDLDNCLNRKLSLAGYDLNKPFKEYSNLAILKRLKKLNE